MNGRDDNFEKYYREMMEMYRRAAIHSEDVPDKKETEEKPEEQEKAAPEPAAEDGNEQQEESRTEVEESDEELPEAETADICEDNDGQNDGEPSFCPEWECPKWAGGIALCEFAVENAKTGQPIENAQVMLYRADGFFVRTLTDKAGNSGEIPVFADGVWRVSVTAHGYISVSKATVKPVAGEKLTIPVRLDESISFDGIFTEHSDSIIGA